MTMQYAVLPDVASLMPVNWNIRFLDRFATVIEEIDPNQSPPLLRLMEMLQDGFVDGCSITMLDKNAVPARGSSSINDVLLGEMDDLEKGEVKEKLIYDYISSITYLALPMDILPRVTKPHVLIMWRHNRVFSPDDVVTARLVLRLFGTRFEPTDIGHWLSIGMARSGAETSADPQMYKNALDAVPDVVLVCALDGRVSGMNIAAQTCFKGILNIIKQAQSNTWVASACHPDDMKDLFTAWGEAAQDHSTKKLRCRVMMEDKKYRKFLWRFVPILDPHSGKEIYWIIVATDLEIAESLEEVKSMAKMKGRFLAEISHEIRTPLACVLGTATLLSHTKLDADQEELLRTITVSSQQLSNLITNVLDLSRIEENKLVVERAPMKIEKCITEIMEQFRTDLARMKLDPVVEIQPSFPLWIVSDELRVRQIITNFVSNAIKFSRPNGIIAVRIQSSTDGERKILTVRVEDEGIGISEAASGDLFESFNQLETSTARKYGGSGLGLVISKKLVELLGGTIGFTSEHGKGTAFFFSMPYEEPTELQMSAAVFTGFVSSSRQVKEIGELLAASHRDQPPNILLAMLHSEVNTHYLMLLGNIPGLILTTAKEKGKPITKPPNTIIITDDCILASAWAPDIAKRELAGVIYADYECPPELQIKGVEFVRKPLRDKQILSAIKCILSTEIPSLTKSKTVETIVVPAPTVLAEMYPLKILIAEDDIFNQQNLDGCEASRRIRAEPGGPHIVAMTANAFTEDRDTCLAAGMCEYASKPVKWEFLEALLKRAHQVATGQSECLCQRDKYGCALT